MADVAELSAQFSALPQNQKALFLAHVAHEATIAARESYIPTPSHPERNFQNPHGPMLRDVNNFVHRVVGYIMCVLEGREGDGQDESVVEMIHEQFGGNTLRLSAWLKKAAQ